MPVSVKTSGDGVSVATASGTFTGAGGGALETFSSAFLPQEDTKTRSTVTRTARLAPLGCMAFAMETFAGVNRLAPPGLYKFPTGVGRRGIIWRRSRGHGRAEPAPHEGPHVRSVPQFATGSARSLHPPARRRSLARR